MDMCFNRLLLKNFRIRVMYIIAILITIFFVYINRNAGAIGYLIDSNSKLIIFANLFMILLFSRMRIYLEISKYSIVRIGNEEFTKNILKSELFFYINFVIFIYIICALFLGIENYFVYLVQVIITISVLALTEILYIRAIYLKHSLMLTLIISYVLLIVHNYWIEPIVFKLLGF